MHFTQHTALDLYCQSPNISSRFLTLGFETDQSLYDVCSDRLVGVKVITKNNENNNAFNVKIIIT